jgi:hypothetical protein
MLRRYAFARMLFVLLTAIFFCGLLPASAQAADKNAPQEEANAAKPKKKKKKDKKEQKDKEEMLPAVKELDKGKDKDKEKEEVDPLLAEFDLPAKEPRLPDSYISSAQRKYKEAHKNLIELLKLIHERETLAEAGGTEREMKKNEREIEKLDKKIGKLKRDIVKDVKRDYKTCTAKLKALKAEKERNDKAVAAAQEAGNDNKATKLAQAFAKKGQSIENLEYAIMEIQYFLFWDPKKRVNTLSAP